MKLTVALAQIQAATAKPTANIINATSLAREAANAGAQLFLLPELWAVGNSLPMAQQLADRAGEGIFAAMMHLAIGHNLYVGGSHLEQAAAGGIYNRAVIYAPNGQEVASYRKVHLFRPMGETDYLIAGDKTPTWELPWGKSFLATCYDLRFPELFRRFRLQGAEIAIIPAEWPSERLHHWRILLQARAIEEQMLIIACNHAGQDTQYHYAGHSMVVNAGGKIIAEAGEDPTLLITTVETNDVAVTRTAFPVLNDRRPAVYDL